MISFSYNLITLSDPRQKKKKTCVIALLQLKQLTRFNDLTISSFFTFFMISCIIPNVDGFPICDRMFA